MDNSKLISSGDFSSKISGGKSNSGDSGVTGSCRSYPKVAVGTTPKVNASKFNPMNTPASTYGLKGTGG